MTISKWDRYMPLVEQMIADNTDKGAYAIASKVLKKQGEKLSRKNRTSLGELIKKRYFAGGEVVTNRLNQANLSSEDWSIAWIKEKGLSILVKNPNRKEGGMKTLEEIREDFKKDLLEASPTFPDFQHNKKKFSDPHCLVIDIADLHIGKLATEFGTGENYNVEMARERALEGVAGILKKSSGFEINQILFVIGNDVLHTDTTGRTTTNGTPQDTDGMWYDNFVIARELYCEIVGGLCKIVPVHVVHNPSNHDFMSSFMLADAVYCYHNKNRNVTFDITKRHRKYFIYGKSLIGTTHGDGAKLDQLPLLMAEEAKQAWADTTYRYFYLHHLHSKHKYKFKAAEDFIGVTVEYLRSASGTDYWHHKNGYQHAKKAVEAFLHSKESGQVARLTHLF